MKVLDSVICKADNAESFKKMRRYLCQAIRLARRRMEKNFYQCKPAFTCVTNIKDKTVQIKCNHGPSLDELEYYIRMYLQARINCGWDRTITEKDS